MKKLYIIKAGSTYPAIAGRFGDFDSWIIDAMGPLLMETCIIDAEHGAELPAAEQCAGAIITGSHAMVTDYLPWSNRLKAWIPSLFPSRIPILGICYGHQILSLSMGGKAGFHPKGSETGTVEIHLLPAGFEDRLFQNLPLSFSAHAAHSQTVVSLPPNAVKLAWNSHDPHQAFRLYDCAWGVQFHPEFSAAIMRAYIEEQAEDLKAAGMHVSVLLQNVSETPFAAQILQNFAGIVIRR